MEARTGDVMFPSHDMSDPSPKHDGSSHDVKVTSGETFMIRDGIRPVYSPKNSKVLGVEGEQLDEINSVILQHIEPCWMLETMQV